MLKVQLLKAVVKELVIYAAPPLAAEQELKRQLLNKDVPAIAYTYDMELIIKAYEMNEEDKKKYKEE